jgi:hypothetical protein
VIKIGRILLPFLFLFAQAQQGTVVSSAVDRDKLEVGDTLTLTVTVQSTESVDIEEPRLPNLNGLDLVQHWDNTAVQQSLVQTSKGMDFKTIRKREFHYAFEAKSQGRYSVDALEVSVNGKLFKTEPFVIQVFPSGSGQVPQANPGRGQRLNQGGGEDDEEDFLRQQEEIFNQLLQRQFGGSGIPQPFGGGNGNRQGKPPANPQFRSQPTNPNDAFFIQLEVDKTSVYEGEQITATWYLLTRGQMESLDRVKFPALRGFWKEVIEENPQIQFMEEIINGVAYRKALLASHALFPIKAGKAVIDEFTVKSRVRMPSRNFGFGLGRSYEYTKSSKRVEIQVKPLPLQGRPSNFTGAVGQYNVSAQVEGTQFPVSQPFTYKIRFEGQGNAKAIELPAMEWPDGIEVYDTKNDSRFFKDGNSFKEFEVLLIPRKEGPMEIPGVHFSFFNPKTGQYEEKQTESVKLTILPAVAGANAPQSSKNFLGAENGNAQTSTEAAKTLPALIESSLLAKEKPGLGLALASGSVSATAPQIWNLWGLAMGLILLTLGGFGWREMKSDSKMVSLRKKLDIQWKKVEAALAADQSKQVGIEIVNAFNLVLSEVSSHKSETQEIGIMLEKLDPDRRLRLGKTLSTCYEEAQLLGFAPDSAVLELRQKANLQALVEKSKTVLNQACE